MDVSFYSMEVSYENEIERSGLCVLRLIGCCNVVFGTFVLNGIGCGGGFDEALRLGRI